MTSFAPFKDEATVLSLDGLTVENRLDRIELYGSVQITRDKAGLALARQLQALLDATVKSLETTASLPEQISTRPVKKVRNPFE